VQTAGSKSDDLPYEGPVVAVPDLGSDSFDEPLEAPSSLPEGRHQELADWCRKRVAEGEDPEYLADVAHHVARRGGISG